MRIARARPPKTEYVEFDTNDGTRHGVLPRALNATQNLRQSTQNSLERLLKTPNTLYQTVWESYLALRDIVDQHKGPPIPQHILQAVLRQCTPSWGALRQNATRPAGDYAAWKRLQSPLPHESRLRSVLHYMKTSGQHPTVEDYNFILQHMASVGHVNGALAVLEEMEASKVQTSAKTFKHILRACVFLLESPVPPEAKPQVSSMVAEIASKVAQRLQDLNLEMDSRLVELTLRMLKEQDNTEACEQILRTACAFDVHRPDRMPDEFEKRLKDADERKLPLPTPVPVTTSMLTTIMSLYGSKGELPRMIAAFEVLTNPYPLPSNLPSPQSDWWDADDEYDVANPVVQTPLKHRPEYIWEPPKARPNSATFAIMIRYLAWAQQRLLCEHYMLLAEEYDKAESVRLRNQLSKELARLKRVSPSTNSDRLPEEAALEMGFIEAPRFHITPAMFQPVLVYANQARLVELMRWMRQHLRMIIRRREKDLNFFKKSYEALPEAEIHPKAEIRLNTKHQIYVDYTAVTNDPDIQKPLDLHFHINLVESTLSGLRTMLERVDEVVARLSQRTLERMTRRVWRHQDVYLSDLGHRTLIGRDEWSERVKWREWNGPITAVNMGLQKMPSTNAVAAPSRWMDSRLAARAGEKEGDEIPDSLDKPK